MDGQFQYPPYQIINAIGNDSTDGDIIFQRRNLNTFYGMVTLPMFLEVG